MKSVQTLSRTIRSALVVILFAFLVSPTDHAAAQGGDNFDGAVWRFKMVPKKGPKRTLTGAFRVSDDVLYQKETRSDPDFTRRVGKNYPKGKRTRFEVTDFRARNEKGNFRNGMKGTGRMTLDRIGEWSGMFTNAKGNNWEFKISRVKE